MQRVCWGEEGAAGVRGSKENIGFLRASNSFPAEPLSGDGHIAFVTAYKDFHLNGHISPPTCKVLPTE